MSLKLEKVSKRYLDKWILRDLDLEVNRGEICGLIGYPASGKTTILNIISGFVKDFTGKISFEDGIIESVEFLNLHQMQDKSSIRRFLGFGKKELPLSYSEKRTKEFRSVLDKANQVLLLDDPFAGLNDYLRFELIHKLKEVTREKNLAVLLATNDSGDIFEACDKVAVLDKGDIIQIGTPREVYENPECVSSARLLGYCNLIEARRITFSTEDIPEFQTVQGSHKIRTDKVQRRKLGAITQTVFLAIRPEHVCINFGASFPEDNLLRAKVTQVNFKGETTRVSLDAGGLKLQSTVLRLVGLSVGDECMIGLPPNRISILRN
jgi:ABC-type Fe3+/spermidine/putrescine transport system ATPase subunit